MAFSGLSVACVWFMFGKTSMILVKQSLIFGCATVQTLVKILSLLTVKWPLIK